MYERRGTYQNKAFTHNQYLNDFQGMVNKFFGATPGQPIKLPIEIPPISLDEETLKEMAEMVYFGTGILATGIVVGALVKAWVQK